MNYLGKINDEKKLNLYLQNKMCRKPIPIGFGAKLTNAILKYIASKFYGQNIEKPNELYELISSEYINLRDIFNDSGYNALKFFFGKRAPIIKEIWITSFDYGYKRGMSRRPFRSKFGITIHYNAKVAMLYEFIRMEALDFDLNTFLDDPYVYEPDPYNTFSTNEAISLLLTYEIDNRNRIIRDKIEKTIYESSGKLCSELLLALVLSKKEWSHELLGNLLLAAKLQEGLRQSIIEIMDGGSVEAFRYLLKLIIDNKLERFSSVVRGFDVWTGLTVSAESPSTVRYYLSVIWDCVSGGNYDTYLKSANPLENYLALLCKGFYEVRDGLDIIEQFIGSYTTARRMVGYFWLSQSGDRMFMMPHFERHIDERQPEVIAFMLPCFYINKYGNKEYIKSLSQLFDNIKSMIDETPSEDRRFSLPGMPGVTANFSHGSLYSFMIAITTLTKSNEMFDTLCDCIDDMSPDNRVDFMSELIKNTTTEKQKNVILMSACDKSERVRCIAYSALKGKKLREDEYLALEKMLSNKAESLRSNIIILLLNQKPDACIETLRRLAVSEDENCRYAARQIVQDMRNLPAYKDHIKSAIKIAGVEDTESDAIIQDTEENGFGLFNPKNLRKHEIQPCPRINLSEVIPDFNEMLDKLKKLSFLVSMNSNYIYERENHDGSRSQIVFGTQNIFADRKNPMQIPLHDVFIPEVNRLFPGPELINALFIILIKSKRFEISDYEKLFIKIFGDSEILDKFDVFWRIPYFNSHIIEYLQQAFYERDDIENFEYMYSVSKNLYDKIVPDIICELILPLNYTRYNMNLNDENDYHYFFGMKDAVTYWTRNMQSINMSDEAFKKFFALLAAYMSAIKYKSTEFMHLSVLVRAFKIGLIGEDDICFYFTRPRLADYMHTSTHRSNELNNMVKSCPEFFKVVNRIIDKAISAELNRGEVSSAMSGLASRIDVCYGIGHFAGIACAMEERNYARGYNFNLATKGQMLSYLLKNLYPAEGDNAEMLHQNPEFRKLSAQKLINAAMYAPQWLGMIEEYLSMPGLLKAGMWFHAHLNEYFSNEKAAIVARYSSILPADFAAGAFDPDWFREALKETGEKNFAMIYKAAKYIAGGSLHKRSQLFADATMNKLNLEELKDRVTSKRNKDYLLTYTLVPIKDQNDALERFIFLESFKKESRNYGLLRQRSEARACEIAIGNLARNAGYNDVNRFVWQMETLKLESVSKWFLPVKSDDIEMQILFDDDGKAFMNVSGNGKKLASIPSKYNEHPLIVEVKSVLKSLREQHKRARASLEKAMIGRDSFRPDELDLLILSPVLAPMLDKLLFVCDDTIGLWKSGGIVSVDGEARPVSGPVYIAHPYDLKKSGKWADWQTYFCKERIKQPFKQVFREYYCPTPDELYEKTISRRYAGHQIMPNKAIMIAASRGWNTTEGIFKAFHKERIVVQLFCGIVYFTPADVEPPVIETVSFFDRDSGKPLLIEDIPPVLFSEAMRDIDLIVSVAHYGEVDPEASLSTIDMRIALIITLLRLMKLENVRLEKSHALIKGQFGEYTVHLGSGIAHMQAKGMLPIVPVHSGQRGRVFLPFADDDPKTAEIVTKVILLAEDNKIKDVNILNFVRS